jgi:phasin family protein
MSKTTEDMTAAPQATAPMADVNDAFKSGFEKIKASSGVMAEHSKANLEAIMTASKINMKSLEEAGAIATAHARTVSEKTSTAIKTLASAKSLQEAVEVQVDFTRSALDNYIADFSKIADVFLGAMKDSAKPISERMSASYTALQSAK